MVTKEAAILGTPICTFFKVSYLFYFPSLQGTEQIVFCGIKDK